MTGALVYLQTALNMPTAGGLCYFVRSTTTDVPALSVGVAHRRSRGCYSVCVVCYTLAEGIVYLQLSARRAPSTPSRASGARSRRTSPAAARPAAASLAACAGRRAQADGPLLR